MSEAELIQAMHEQRASVDLEYTPITTPLPELVRAEELAALREEYSRLYVMWENAMATVRAERARSVELEARLALVDSYGRACHLAGQYGGAKLSFAAWQEARAAWKERERQAWGVQP